MTTSVGIKVPPWAVKAVEIWKHEIQLTNQATGLIHPNHIAYGLIIQDFAECYLKDKGMTKEAFERFQRKYQ